jgi:hypothetical protein
MPTCLRFKPYKKLRQETALSNINMPTDRYFETAIILTFAIFKEKFALILNLLCSNNISASARITTLSSMFIPCKMAIFVVCLYLGFLSTIAVVLSYFPQFFEFVSIQNQF